MGLQQDQNEADRSTEVDESTAAMAADGARESISEKSGPAKGAGVEKRDSKGAESQGDSGCTPEEEGKKQRNGSEEVNAAAVAEQKDVKEEEEATTANESVRAGDSSMEAVKAGDVQAGAEEGGEGAHVALKPWVGAKWTSEEDEILLDYVERYGPTSWNSVAWRTKKAFSRGAEACKKRWSRLQAKMRNRGAIPPGPPSKRRRKVVSKIPFSCDGDREGAATPREQEERRNVQSSEESGESKGLNHYHSVSSERGALAAQQQADGGDWGENMARNVQEFLRKGDEKNASGVKGGTGGKKAKGGSIESMGHTDVKMEDAHAVRDEGSGNSARGVGARGLKPQKYEEDAARDSHSHRGSRCLIDLNVDLHVDLHVDSAPPLVDAGTATSGGSTLMQECGPFLGGGGKLSPEETRRFEVWSATQSPSKAAYPNSSSISSSLSNVTGMRPSPEQLLSPNLLGMLGLTHSLPPRPSWVASSLPSQTHASGSVSAKPTSASPLEQAAMASFLRPCTLLPSLERNALSFANSAPSIPMAGRSAKVGCGGGVEGAVVSRRMEDSFSGRALEAEGRGGESLSDHSGVTGPLGSRSRRMQNRPVKAAKDPVNDVSEAATVLVLLTAEGGGGAAGQKGGERGSRLHEGVSRSTVEGGRESCRDDRRGEEGCRAADAHDASLQTWAAVRTERQERTKRRLEELSASATRAKAQRTEETVQAVKELWGRWARDCQRIDDMHRKEREECLLLDRDVEVKGDALGHLLRSKQKEMMLWLERQLEMAKAEPS